MPDQNFPSPSPAFRGSSQSPPKNLFDTAAKWAPKGLNLPPAATLALYAGRLVDKLTGDAYSADQLAKAHFTPKHVTEAPDDIYEVTAEDNGKLLLIEVADATVVQLRVAELPAGFNVGVAQWGAGTLTFETDEGTIRSEGDLVATAAQYAVVSVATVFDGTFFLSGSLA